MLDSFLAFQESFDHKPVLAYLRGHDEILVMFIVLYLTLVFYVPEVLKKPATFLGFPMMLWNMFLGLFSILGTYYLTIDFVKMTYANGFKWSICTEPSESHVDGTTGFWLMLFILSKIPELLDTAFLVLMKKDVIFLQWFHHVSTMAYCWYAYTHQIGVGWWFAGLNFGVHAIMYPFFGFSYWKSLRPLLAKIAPFITTLQIVQMFVGLFVLVAQRYYFYSGDISDAAAGATQKSTTCSGYHEGANRLGIGMYVSYAVLFANLFIKKYISGGKKKSSGQTGAGKSEVVVLGGGSKMGRKSGVEPSQHRSNMDADEGLCNATAEAMKEIHGSNPETLASPSNNNNNSKKNN